jgi:2-phospho-L-lactate transferase/gluconeogenesis factor (CofD/UPF0052 family)
MTQANESLGRTAADHIRALEEHAQAHIFDYALINRKPVPVAMREQYAEEGQSPVVADLEAIERLGVCPVLGDYLATGEVARHDTTRVACDLLDLRTPVRQQPRRDAPSP